MKKENNLIMNRYLIRRASSDVASAAEVPAALRAIGAEYVAVSNVNWPAEYPYQPGMEFAAAHTGDALLLHYRVQEQSVRAVSTADQQHIWEDSCAEFFIMPAADGFYYNLECNCTGKLLVAVGKDRNERRPAPPEAMKAVDRWASLGCQPFDVREEPTTWELALRVPIGTFFRHDLKSLSGLVAKGNIYKCGDMLPVPHFLSWNPIHTVSPDFHRPEFFGEIAFE